MSIPFEEETYAEGKARRDAAFAEAREAQTVQVYKSRTQQLLDGDISVEDLDDDELMRGQLRNKNGVFSGRGAEMVPRKLHTELTRRILQRGAEKIRSDFFDAIDVIGSVMRDEGADPAIRIKAAGMIIDRIAGKTPEKVELSVEVKPWQQTMDSIYRPIDPDQVLTAEVLDDDDD